MNQNIAVAIAEAGRDGEIRSHGIISSDLQNVEKVLRRLGHPHKELRVVCYEAGPCGFVLARRLKQWGTLIGQPASEVRTHYPLTRS